MACGECYTRAVAARERRRVEYHLKLGTEIYRMFKPDGPEPTLEQVIKALDREEVSVVWTIVKPPGSGRWPNDDDAVVSALERYLMSMPLLRGRFDWQCSVCRAAA